MSVVVCVQERLAELQRVEEEAANLRAERESQQAAVRKAEEQAEVGVTNPRIEALRVTIRVALACSEAAG
jgi:hypothetical protein